MAKKMGINSSSVQARFRNATFDEALDLLSRPKTTTKHRRKMFLASKKLWEGKEYDTAEYKKDSKHQGGNWRAATQKKVTLPKLKFLEKKDED
jgi:hypothetical protein